MVTDANYRFLKIVGCTRDDLRKDLTAPERIQKFELGLEKLTSNGNAAPCEKEFLRKDGTRVPTLVGAVALDGDAGYVGFVLDISDRKKAEAELLRLATAVEQASEMVLI